MKEETSFKSTKREELNDWLKACGLSEKQIAKLGKDFGNVDELDDEQFSALKGELFPSFIKMTVPDRLPATFWKQANKFQIIYSLAGLTLGLICIVGGILLFIRGIVGSSSWTAKIVGAESNISDAAPGVILFIVGLFIILVTKYSVKVRR
jgi:hypothetical protein